jgi:hypothetical protein
MLMLQICNVSVFGCNFRLWVLAPPKRPWHVSGIRNLNQGSAFMTAVFAYTRLSGGSIRTMRVNNPRRLIGLAFWG